MMTALHKNEFVPTPLHRALDQITALKIEVQGLERRLRRDTHCSARPSAEREVTVAGLSHIAQHLDTLSDLLPEIERESPQIGGPREPAPQLLPDPYQLEPRMRSSS
jgi:hypothetical protein